MMLLAVKDPISMERIRRFAKQREVATPMRAAKKIGRGRGTHVSKRYLRKLAARGGNMRAHKLSKKRLSESACRAALARWAKAA
jgi:hypothetical protein